MPPRCFVIGHPVAHSRSPLIHGTWLAEHGLAGSYERVDVAPADLPGFVERLRAGEFTGGNVTVPHKQAMLPQIDEVSEAARAVGAVNTVWRDGACLGRFPESVRLYTPETLGAVLCGAGLAVERVFGDYRDVPPGPDAPRLIFVCRKGG